ncbi:putative ATP-dependent transporter SufC [candidate division SR1 bacterium Aalborg_AAW-1]|nr:putative ATP-dependent transporter SufC [candidate division SR1 bacterium Aalborg_AAW-1]
MLLLEKLSIAVEDKTIIQDLSLNFELGKNYCLLGKNGSGKSSLAMAIMGHPSYEVTNGKLLVNNGIEDIDVLQLDPHERAKLGIFVAFQTIPEIKGVKLFEFLRSIYNATLGQNLSFVQFKKHILPLCDALKINTEFLRRDVNVGFSGGERRKIEMLQLKLLNPKYIFLDEVDSGLDVDAFRDVANMIQELNTTENTFIIITHYFTILDYIPVDQVYVLESGKIVKEGDINVALEIKEKGFN